MSAELEAPQFLLHVPTRSLHRRDCAVLMGLTGEMRNFAGLEHALLDRRILWCGCSLELVTRSLARLFAKIGAGARGGVDPEWIALSDALTRAAAIFERRARQLGQEWGGNTVGETPH